MNRIHHRALALASCTWLASALAGCLDEPRSVAAQENALKAPAAALGRTLFERPFPHTNGRACATCHVLDEASTLRPASVSARLAQNPDDPLFDRMDADDPDAPELSFKHLEKGLVRVVIPLPDNMDVIDFEGHVITPADRKVFVWRGVPSVADTALTGPYQLDGRAATLQLQAQAAIHSHSAGPDVSSFELDRIAHFQRGIFSSPRAALVAQLRALGVPEDKLPIPEQFFPLTEAQMRGREVYNAACQACHGGASTDRIVRRDVADLAFLELKPDGNVRYVVSPGQNPTPARRSRPGEKFMNVGFGVLTYFGQIGLAKTYNSSVSLPQYRFRFYRDASRTEVDVDLPPVPVTVSGDPRDPRPALDQDGAPIVGPNLAPQQFTTDPGPRAHHG